MNKNIKIIFFGSANFSIPILTSLIEKFEVLAVVTEPDKPAGRGLKLIEPPTKVLAQKNNISIFQPEKVVNNTEFIKQLKKIKADLYVVAAYGKILPFEVINLPKHGSLNVHPSLLPKYRGASPIQTALLNQDKVTGSSIILMDQGMDTGDIVVQKQIEINDKDDYSTLSQKLSILSAELLTKHILQYTNREITLQTQKDNEAEYCYKINKQQGEIIWDLSADLIWSQMKAFKQWPGIYTFFKKKKLDIVSAQPANLNINDEFEIGEVLKFENNVYVKCGKNFLKLNTIKIEGKNPVEANLFVNGYHDFIGTKLGV